VEEKEKDKNKTKIGAKDVKKNAESDGDDADREEGVNKVGHLFDVKKKGCD
jgi:hypothetical protein